MARNSEITVLVKVKDGKIICEIDSINYRLIQLKKLIRKILDRRYYNLLFLFWLVSLEIVAYPYGIEAIIGLTIIIFISFLLGWKSSTNFINKKTA